MICTANKFTPQELKTSIIQISSYKDKNFEGVLQNGYCNQVVVFTNLTQLLFFMEALQNHQSFPKRYMETRTFKDTPPQSTPPSKTNHPPGKVLATFKVHHLFRQNASWQGNVTWVETGMDASFRSALELVILMDSVLS